MGEADKAALVIFFWLCKAASFSFGQAFLFLAEKKKRLREAGFEPAKALSHCDLNAAE